MKRALAAALFAAAPGMAAAQVPDCMGQIYGPSVPFKGKPKTFVDADRTDNGRVIWGFCQLDPTRRATAWVIVCKHGVCSLGDFVTWSDFIRRAPNVLEAARAVWTQFFGPTSPTCYANDASGALVVAPTTFDVDLKRRVPSMDVQWNAACAEALPLILATWPDPPPAPPPPPPPPPAPAPAPVPAPASVWRVKPATGGTRVVFAINGDRIGLPTAETVPVGTLCDPSFTFVSSGITYMRVSLAGAAVCVRVDQ